MADPAGAKCDPQCSSASTYELSCPPALASSSCNFSASCVSDTVPGAADAAGRRMSLSLRRAHASLEDR